MESNQRLVSTYRERISEAGGIGNTFMQTNYWHCLYYLLSTYTY